MHRRGPRPRGRCGTYGAVRVTRSPRHLRKDRLRAQVARPLARCPRVRHRNPLRLSEAVILAAGFSPAIGFIHEGDPRSLVFDLADTVKFKTVVPLAFDVFLSDAHDVRSSVRRACRDLFRESQMIETLMDNLLFAMGV